MYNTMVMEKKRIAILIPCYNEEQTIGKVIEDCKSFVPQAIIYVYDNNSTDNTLEIARASGAIVKRERQQGKGSVLRSMFRDIDADCYLTIDGDDQCPLDKASEMMRIVMEEDVDMVIGDRLSSTYFTENKRPFHNFGNVLVKFLINKLFKSDIRDILCGYRAFSRRFVKTFPVISNGFEIETEMTIHAIDKRLNIENITVDFKNRPEGNESKLNTYRDGIKVLKKIFSLYINYKPLAFFSMFALFLFLLSAGFMIPVLIDYFHTGLVMRFPTLIVCGFVALMAILSFFTGLILDNIVKLKKQEFEILLNEVSYNEK